MGPKLTIALTLATLIVATAPAAAGQNGTDYVNYMRKWRPALQSEQVRANSSLRTPVRSHRYQGGSRDVH